MEIDLAATSGNQAVQGAEDPPPDVTKQVLTAEQRRSAVKLRNEFERQGIVLQAIIHKQIQLTGQDPISKNEAASKTVEKATASGAPIKVNREGLPEAVAGTSPAAKTSRLSPESEAVLLTLFGVQDMLGREDAQVLANQAGCSESQVREYFTKLRSNVRSFMQRLQRKVTAAEAPSAAPAPATQLPTLGSGPSAALVVSLPGQPTQSQHAAVQLPTALTLAASSAPSAGLQPQASAAFPQLQGAPPARPMSASQPQASPMTATDLRTLLANVTSAQVALQQSAASTGSASLAEEAGAAAAVTAAAGPSMDDLMRMDAARKAGLVELQRYLDDSGGVASAKHAGPVASLMARAASAEVREALLQALARTASSQVLAQLAGSGRALDMLDGWARWAEMDRQSTVLRLLLSVLQRLPVPTALIKGSGLQRTIGHLQKYRTPGIATAATALLQQWYHLEQPPFPVATGPMAPPPPPVRVAAPAQAPPGPPAQSAAPPRPASMQMHVFKPGSPRSAVPQTNASDPSPAHMTFQQSHGQAELLKPSSTFYRGMAGRLGSSDKPESPRRVLSADEIVKAKEKERSRLAGAAGLVGRPGPSKSSRLDAASLLDFANNRRAQPRPSTPSLLHSQGRVSQGTLPVHQQGLAGRPSLQQPQQQQPWQMPKQSQPQRRPISMPHASATTQRQPPSANHRADAAPLLTQPKRPQQTVNPPPRQLQPRQEPPAWRPTVPWATPQPVAQPSQWERPASGEQSEEAARQRARNLHQPGRSYEGLEGIPPSPAEPDWDGQDAGAGEQARVPILPTDPFERAQQLQALQSVGVPVDMLLGL